MARSGIGARGPKHLTPHVTLMYVHGGIETQPIEPIGWEVREFGLVLSHIGEGRHVHLGRWPLQD